VANLRVGRRSGLVLRGGRNRRDTLWIGSPSTDTTIAAANTAVLILSLGAAGLALRPFTVVRVRCYWHLKSDQTANTEAWGASIGYAVVSDQASAIGVTAVPTPETDKSSDLWMLHATRYGQYSVSSAIGVLEQGFGENIDSKAMRKVQEGEDFITVLETPNITGSARVLQSDRILLKLH